MNEIIKMLRKKHNLSQKIIAITLGVTPSVVSQWETGIKQPSKDNLKKLAEMYGVSVDYFFGNETNSKQAKDEEELLIVYRRLNMTGQKRALETLQLFATLPEYQEKDIQKLEIS